MSPIQRSHGTHKSEALDTHIKNQCSVLSIALYVHRHSESVHIVYVINFCQYYCKLLAFYNIQTKTTYSYQKTGRGISKL